jgi:hypothetical protein
MSQALLIALEQRARARGYDLFGIVDTQRFDAAQPAEGRCAREFAGCGTAIVLGSGAPRLAEAEGPGELLRMLTEAGLRARLAPPLRSTIRFACLGEAAGFGTVSPVIHRLLHPAYGPRVSVRAVLLVEGLPFGAIADATIADRFQPCCNCSRPCVAACPADVHDGLGASDLRRCYDERLSGSCTTGCEVVRHCPIGAANQVPSEVERQRHEFDLQRLAVREGRGLLHALRRILWF